MTIADKLILARSERSKKPSIYTNEFWASVEENVKREKEDFDHPSRDTSMTYETLHKPFTI